MKILLIGLVLLLSLRVSAEQEVEIQAGSRGQIKIRIVEGGRLVATAVPNLDHRWNQILRPNQQPVELPLFRNLNRVFDEKRILGALEVLELCVIENRVFAVTRERDAKPGAPFYLMRVNTKLLAWSDLVHLALPGAAMSMAGVLALSPPAKIGVAAEVFGVTASLIVAAKFAREILAELKDLTGSAHPLASGHDYMHVSEMIFEGPRVVDVRISTGQSLREALTCGTTLL